MKLNLNKKSIILLAVQLLLAAFLVICIPIANQIILNKEVDLKVLFYMTMGWTFPLVFIYFVNFYGVIPYLFERKKYLWFLLANIILIGFANFHLFEANVPSPDPYAHAGFNMFVGVVILLDIIAVGFALGIRYFIRANRIEMQLKEIKQKNAEAELAWLRNQLNPHFMFNALNNISSLTQIDPDQAQDSIAQLSDLLRYAMYEARNERVSLSKDVEFMSNYIAMMKLRCSEKTIVTTNFDIENPETEIAPMLFISLIENAFKHGVSNSHDSFVKIELKQKADEISFKCSNSDFHKTDKDRSGKGVGLDNTRRRLDLLYKDNYSWEHDCEERIYKTNIILHLK